MATAIAQLTSFELNAIADTFPGGGIESPGSAPGQLGKVIEFETDAEALMFSKTSVGTLLKGKYMYVKTKASPTTTPLKGLLARWSDRDDFVVSADQAGDPDSGNIAGVFLATTGDGKYVWIQIDGFATVKFKSTTTKATPDIGDAVIAGLDADNGLADVLADATAVTFGTAATKLSRWVGRLYGAVASQFATVKLNLNAQI